MQYLKKVNYKQYIILVIFFIFLIMFIISVFKILIWLKDSNNVYNEVKEIEQIVDVQETNDNENTEIIKQNDDEIKPLSPYLEYIKMNLINVDFKELKSINSDTVGWIQVNDTNINYPFVQAKDNSFYLTHSFNKSYNDAGWVFLDYRNNLDKNTDKNIILYAHSRLDKTMFGSLTKILKNSWLNDKNNYIIRLSTENENTLWQIFSVYHIPTTNDYLKINFQNDSDYSIFINTLLDRSNYNFNTNVNITDKILTLSTCYNDKEKFVAHSKLIKREKRI